MSVADALASGRKHNLAWHSHWRRSRGWGGGSAAGHCCRAAPWVGARAPWRGRPGSFPVATWPFRWAAATLSPIRPTPVIPPDAEAACLLVP